MENYDEVTKAARPVPDNLEFVSGTAIAARINEDARRDLEFRATQTRLAHDAFADMGRKLMMSVDEFQSKVQELPVPAEPSPLAPHRFDFRIKFLMEEIGEFTKAYQEGNLDDQVDGLVDLIYVALGALLEMGIPPYQAFNPVHAANMRKTRGMTERNDMHDAVKPQGWIPPSHARLIAEMKLRLGVRPALLEATKIVLSRGEKYNHGEDVRREDHFPFGMTSIFQMMWVKIVRMKADIAASRPVDRDHFIDIINYASFGVDHIDGRKM